MTKMSCEEITCLMRMPQTDTRKIPERSPKNKS